MRTLGLVSCVAVALAASSTAQSFTIVSSGTAVGVSDDGSVVVGTDNDTGDPYWWHSTLGKMTLPGADNAVDVSGDGFVVLGELYPPYESSTWNLGAGVWEPHGGIGDTCDAFWSNPYAISADGTKAVGLGWQGCTTSAYVWTDGAGMVALPKLGSNSARANEISGDGLTVGGWDEHSTGPRRAAVWWPNGTEELLLEGQPGNDEGFGEVWAISSDGTWVGCMGLVGEGPWLYSQSTGLQNLGWIPGASPGQRGNGRAISDDGTIVVGNFTEFFNNRAFIWQDGVGIQWFEDYLTSIGLSFPSTLVVTDMSPDGTKIVGYTLSNFGFPEDAFLVDLEPSCGITPYQGGSAPANYLVLSGSGDSSVGGTMIATTENVPGPTAFMALSLGSAIFPLLGGLGHIHPGALIGGLIPVPAVAGTATIGLPIPSNPSFAGVSVYMQSIAPDALQLEGWALSYGLQLEICP